MNACFPVTGAIDPDVIKLKVIRKDFLLLSLMEDKNSESRANRISLGMWPKEQPRMISWVWSLNNWVNGVLFHEMGDTEGDVGGWQGNRAFDHVKLEAPMDQWRGQLYESGTQEKRWNLKYKFASHIESHRTVSDYLESEDEEKREEAEERAPEAANRLWRGHQWGRRNNRSL